MQPDEGKVAMTDYQQQQQPAQAYGGGGPSGPRSGFWIRFGAALIDGLLVGVPLSIIEVVAGIYSNTAARSGLQILVFVLYFGFFEGSPSGQTVGKKVCGIRVIDFNSGGSIGYG